ncbi:hypothetical protein TRFO_10941 [Tritrichomonas foetus]|uniref:Uncharacterized protein n=1 Tax=Tritrichomonas foetus TaxID=1144522 RepID=A0A1J4JBF4_9EUKA|nr:hypothetical protein TRFO_10941 [Tritrichomonas foetus]|eukprot:OHS94765.1 hypothetical protein TRFO_10941 [Tritrichomonas foetus]
MRSSLPDKDRPDGPSNSRKNQLKISMTSNTFEISIVDSTNSFFISNDNHPNSLSFNTFDLVSLDTSPHEVEKLYHKFNIKNENFDPNQQQIPHKTLSFVHENDITVAPIRYEDVFGTISDDDFIPILSKNENLDEFSIEPLMVPQKPGNSMSPDDNLQDEINLIKNQISREPQSVKFEISEVENIFNNENKFDSIKFQLSEMTSIVTQFDSKSNQVNIFDDNEETNIIKNNYDIQPIKFEFSEMTAFGSSLTDDYIIQNNVIPDYAIQNHAFEISNDSNYFEFNQPDSISDDVSQNLIDENKKPINFTINHEMLFELENNENQFPFFDSHRISTFSINNSSIFEQIEYPNDKVTKATEGIEEDENERLFVRNISEDSNSIQNFELFEFYKEKTELGYSNALEHAFYHNDQGDLNVSHSFRNFSDQTIPEFTQSEFVSIISLNEDSKDFKITPSDAFSISLNAFDSNISQDEIEENEEEEEIEKDPKTKNFVISLSQPYELINDNILNRSFLIEANNNHIYIPINKKDSHSDVPIQDNKNELIESHMPKEKLRISSSHFIARNETLEESKPSKLDISVSTEFSEQITQSKTELGISKPSILYEIPESINDIIEEIIEEEEIVENKELIEEEEIIDPFLSPQWQLSHIIPIIDKKPKQRKLSTINSEVFNRPNEKVTIPNYKLLKLTEEFSISQKPLNLKRQKQAVVADIYYKTYLSFRAPFECCDIESKPINASKHSIELTKLKLRKIHAFEIKDDLLNRFTVFRTDNISISPEISNLVNVETLANEERSIMMPEKKHKSRKCQTLKISPHLEISPNKEAGIEIEANEMAKMKQLKSKRCQTVISSPKLEISQNNDMIIRPSTKTYDLSNIDIFTAKPITTENKLESLHDRDFVNSTILNYIKNESFEIVGTGFSPLKENAPFEISNSIYVDHTLTNHELKKILYEIEEPSFELSNTSAIVSLNINEEDTRIHVNKHDYRDANLELSNAFELEAQYLENIKNHQFQLQHLNQSIDIIENMKKDNLSKYSEMENDLEICLIDDFKVVSNSSFELNLSSNNDIFSKNSDIKPKKLKLKLMKLDSFDHINFVKKPILSLSQNINEFKILDKIKKENKLNDKNIPPMQFELSPISNILAINYQNTAQLEISEDTFDIMESQSQTNKYSYSYDIIVSKETSKIRIEKNYPLKSTIKQKAKQMKQKSKQFSLCEKSLVFEKQTHLPNLSICSCDGQEILFNKHPKKQKSKAKNPIFNVTKLEVESIKPISIRPRKKKSPKYSISSNPILELEPNEQDVNTLKENEYCCINLEIAGENSFVSTDDVKFIESSLENVISIKYRSDVFLDYSTLSVQESLLNSEEDRVHDIISEITEKSAISQLEVKETQFFELNKNLKRDMNKKSREYKPITFELYNQDIVNIIQEKETPQSPSTPTFEISKIDIIFNDETKIHPNSDEIVDVQSSFKKLKISRSHINEFKRRIRLHHSVSQTESQPENQIEKINLSDKTDYSKLVISEILSQEKVASKSNKQTTKRKVPKALSFYNSQNEFISLYKQPNLQIVPSNETVIEQNSDQHHVLDIGNPIISNISTPDLKLIISQSFINERKRRTTKNTQQNQMHKSSPLNNQISLSNSMISEIPPNILEFNKYFVNITDIEPNNKKITTNSKIELSSFQSNEITIINIPNDLVLSPPLDFSTSDMPYKITNAQKQRKVSQLNIKNDSIFTCEPDLRLTERAIALVTKHRLDNSPIVLQESNSTLSKLSISKSIHKDFLSQPKKSSRVSKQQKLDLSLSLLQYEGRKENIPIIDQCKFEIASIVPSITEQLQSNSFTNKLSISKSGSHEIKEMKSVNLTIVPNNNIEIQSTSLPETPKTKSKKIQASIKTESNNTICVQNDVFNIKPVRKNKKQTKKTVNLPYQNNKMKLSLSSIVAKECQYEHNLLQISKLFNETIFTESITQLDIFTPQDSIDILSISTPKKKKVGRNKGVQVNKQQNPLTLNQFEILGVLKPLKSELGISETFNKEIFETEIDSKGLIQKEFIKATNQRIENLSKNVKLHLSQQNEFEIVNDIELVEEHQFTTYHSPESIEILGVSSPHKKKQGRNMASQTEEVVEFGISSLENIIRIDYEALVSNDTILNNSIHKQPVLLQLSETPQFLECPANENEPKESSITNIKEKLYSFKPCISLLYSNDYFTDPVLLSFANTESILDVFEKKSDFESVQKTEPLHQKLFLSNTVSTFVNEKMVSNAFEISKLYSLLDIPDTDSTLSETKAKLQFSSAESNEVTLNVNFHNLSPNSELFSYFNQTTKKPESKPSFKLSDIDILCEIAIPTEVMTLSETILYEKQEKINFTISDMIHEFSIQEESIPHKYSFTTFKEIAFIEKSSHQPIHNHIPVFEISSHNLVYEADGYNCATSISKNNESFEVLLKKATLVCSKRPITYEVSQSSRSLQLQYSKCEFESLTQEIKTQSKIVHNTIFSCQSNKSKLQISNLINNTYSSRIQMTYQSNYITDFISANNRKLKQSLQLQTTNLFEDIQTNEGISQDHNKFDIEKMSTFEIKPTKFRDNKPTVSISNMNSYEAQENTVNQLEICEVDNQTLSPSKEKLHLSSSYDYETTEISTFAKENLDCIDIIPVRVDRQEIIPSPNKIHPPLHESNISIQEFIVQELKNELEISPEICLREASIATELVIKDISDQIAFESVRENDHHIEIVENAHSYEQFYKHEIDLEMSLNEIDIISSKKATLNINDASIVEEKQFIPKLSNSSKNIIIDKYELISQNQENNESLASVNILDKTHLENSNTESFEINQNIPPQFTTHESMSIFEIKDDTEIMHKSNLDFSLIQQFNLIEETKEFALNFNVLADELPDINSISSLLGNNKGKVKLDYSAAFTNESSNEIIESSNEMANGLALTFNNLVELLPTHESISNSESETKEMKYKDVLEVSAALYTRFENNIALNLQLLHQESLDFYSQINLNIEDDNIMCVNLPCDNLIKPLSISDCEIVDIEKPSKDCFASLEKYIAEPIDIVKDVMTLSTVSDCYQLSIQPTKSRLDESVMIDFELHVNNEEMAIAEVKPEANEAEKEISHANSQSVTRTLSEPNVFEVPQDIKFYSIVFGGSQFNLDPIKAKLSFSEFSFETESSILHEIEENENIENKDRIANDVNETQKIPLAMGDAFSISEFTEIQLSVNDLLVDFQAVNDVIDIENRDNEITKEEIQSLKLNIISEPATFEVSRVIPEFSTVFGCSHFNLDPIKAKLSLSGITNTESYNVLSESEPEIGVEDKTEIKDKAVENDSFTQNMKSISLLIGEGISISAFTDQELSINNSIVDYQVIQKRPDFQLSDSVSEYYNYTFNFSFNDFEIYKQENDFVRNNISIVPTSDYKPILVVDSSENCIEQIGKSEISGEKQKLLLNEVHTVFEINNEEPKVNLSIELLDSTTNYENSQVELTFSEMIEAECEERSTNKFEMSENQHICSILLTNIPKISLKEKALILNDSISFEKKETIFEELTIEEEENKNKRGKVSLQLTTTNTLFELIKDSGEDIIHIPPIENRLSSLLEIFDYEASSQTKKEISISAHKAVVLITEEDLLFEQYEEDSLVNQKPILSTELFTKDFIDEIKLNLELSDITNILTLNEETPILPQLDHQPTENKEPTNKFTFFVDSNIFHQEPHCGTTKSEKEERIKQKLSLNENNFYEYESPIRKQSLDISNTEILIDSLWTKPQVESVHSLSLSSIIHEIDLFENHQSNLQTDGISSISIFSKSYEDTNLSTMRSGVSYEVAQNELNLELQTATLDHKDIKPLDKPISKASLELSEFLQLIHANLNDQNYSLSTNLESFSLEQESSKRIENANELVKEQLSNSPAELFESVSILNHCVVSDKIDLFEKKEENIKFSESELVNTFSIKESLMNQTNRNSQLISSNELNYEVPLVDSFELINENTPIIKERCVKSINYINDFEIIRFEEESQIHHIENSNNEEKKSYSQFTSDIFTLSPREKFNEVLRIYDISILPDSKAKLEIKESHEFVEFSENISEIKESSAGNIIPKSYQLSNGSIFNLLPETLINSTVEQTSNAQKIIHERETVALQLSPSLFQEEIKLNDYVFDELDESNVKHQLTQYRIESQPTQEIHGISPKNTFDFSFENNVSIDPMKTHQGTTGYSPMIDLSRVFHYGFSQLGFDYSQIHSLEISDEFDCNFSLASISNNSNKVQSIPQFTIQPSIIVRQVKKSSLDESNILQLMYSKVESFELIDSENSSICSNAHMALIKKQMNEIRNLQRSCVKKDVENESIKKKYSTFKNSARECLSKHFQDVRRLTEDNATLLEQVESLHKLLGSTVDSSQKSILSLMKQKAAVGWSISENVEIFQHDQRPSLYPEVCDFVIDRGDFETSPNVLISVTVEDIEPNNDFAIIHKSQAPLQLIESNNDSKNEKLDPKRDQGGIIEYSNKIKKLYLSNSMVSADVSLVPHNLRNSGKVTQCSEPPKSHFVALEVTENKAVSFEKGGEKPNLTFSFSHLRVARPKLPPILHLEDNSTIAHFFTPKERVANNDEKRDNSQILRRNIERHTLFSADNQNNKKSKFLSVHGSSFSILATPRPALIPTFVSKFEKSPSELVKLHTRTIQSLEFNNAFYRFPLILSPPVSQISILPQSIENDQMSDHDPKIKQIPKDQIIPQKSEHDLQESNIPLYSSEKVNLEVSKITIGVELPDNNFYDNLHENLNHDKETKRYQNIPPENILRENEAKIRPIPEISTSEFSQTRNDLCISEFDAFESPTIGNTQQLDREKQDKLILMLQRRVLSLNEELKMEHLRQNELISEMAHIRMNYESLLNTRAE